MVLTTLVHVPHFITAATSTLSLAVYRSPLVKHDSEMWKPVQQYLDTHQHELVASKCFDDETMMFGKGIYDEYSVTTS